MDIQSPAGMIEAARKLAGLSQRELADRAGTSQPAVARMESGQGSPNLATLERLVAAAGFALKIELVPIPGPDQLVEAYKRDVDRTLIRENLKKTVDERIRELADLQEFDRELRRAMHEAKTRR